MVGGQTVIGTVTTNPSGTSFAQGAVVTLTATPDVGSPWIGWSGSAVSKSQTISATMNGGPSLCERAMLPELLKLGGAMMWLLVLAGAVAVVVFVERLRHYHREQHSSRN